MSNDRVVANTLEQATSSDFNAAQAMQARRLNDWVALTEAVHGIPIPGDNSASLIAGDSRDTLSAVISGLNVYAGTSTTCIIGPGSMTQIAPSWVSTPDPDGLSQTGFLRQATSMTYPATSGMSVTADNAWHLLCVRLIENVTLTDSVNIFDVPTQQFVLTSVTKRVELGLEFAWVSGVYINSTTMTLPSLDAAGFGWEPLAYVSAVSGGTLGNANSGRVIDVARRVAGLRGFAGGPVGNFAHRFRLGAEYDGRLQSAFSPDAGPGNVPNGLAGNILGHINGETALLSVSQIDRQLLTFEATDGSSFTTNDLLHYYLVPFGSATRIRWPLRTRTSATVNYNSGVTRGILCLTKVQPTRRKTNSTGITLYESSGNRGRWVNQAEAPAGSALYVGSAHVRAVSSMYAFVQSSGGSMQYALGDPIAGYECPLLLSLPAASGLTALTRAYQLDLRNMVPRIATHVTIAIVGAATSTDNFPTKNYQVLNYVDNVANQNPGQVGGLYPNAGTCLAAGTLAYEPETGSSSVNALVMRVPVGWAPSMLHGDVSASPYEGYHFNLVIWEYSRKTGSGLAVAASSVRLLGWDI